MKKERFLTIGLGEVLWDMLPQGKQLGGAPANVAFHAQNLGCTGVVVSCVGNDANGKEILGQLNNLGLETEFISVDPDHPTGTVTVKLNPSGEPQYTIHEDVAWDYIPFSSEIKNLAGRADAVCFGTLAQRSNLSRQAITRFLNHTKKDCLRLYDVNLRQSFYTREIIEQSLKQSNLLKLNDEELPLVAKLFKLDGNEDELLKKIIELYSLDLIALTKGKEGSRIMTRSEDIHFKENVDKIADTVGAGDSFSAALITGLLEKKPLKEIHRRAALVAGYVCTQKGATPMLPKEV